MAFSPSRPPSALNSVRSRTPAYSMMCDVRRTDSPSPPGHGGAPDRRRATRLIEVFAPLEGGGDLLPPQPLQVPGIELAQVPGGALRPQVLLGPIHHPEQLRDHLFALRRRRAGPRQLLEDPWVAERSAGDHHRVGARRLVGVVRRVCGVEAAGDDHRYRDAIDQLPGEGVVRLPLVLGRGRPRMEADRRDAGLVSQPQRQIEPLAAAAGQSGAKLDRDGQPAAVSRGRSQSAPPDRGLRAGRLPPRSCRPCARDSPC